MCSDFCFKNITLAAYGKTDHVLGRGSREDSGCPTDEDNGHNVELAACLFSLGFVKHNQQNNTDVTEW